MASYESTTTSFPACISVLQLPLKWLSVERRSESEHGAAVHSALSDDVTSDPVAEYVAADDGAKSDSAVRSGAVQVAIEVSVLRYSRNRVQPLEIVVGINGLTPELETVEAVAPVGGGGRVSAVPNNAL